MKRKNERNNSVLVGSLANDVADGATVPSRDNICIGKRKNDVFRIKPVTKATTETSNWIPNIAKTHRIPDNAHEFSSRPSTQNRTRMTAISGNIKAKVRGFNPTRNDDPARRVTPANMKIKPDDRIVGRL